MVDAGRDSSGFAYHVGTVIISAGLSASVRGCSGCIGWTEPVDSPYRIVSLGRPREPQSQLKGCAGRRFYLDSWKSLIDAENGKDQQSSGSVH